MNEDRVLDTGRRRTLGVMASLAAISALAPYDIRARPGTSQETPALKQGTFTAEVDDIKVYGEVRGSGPLIILQNGMWLSSFTDHFGAPFTAELAPHFTVLTFDGRGQGRSSAGKGPITYGRFAADTVRLMDFLGIDQAHFIGHSDGGCIQLHLLLDFADRVRTATLVGTAYGHESYAAKTKSLFSVWFDQMVQGKDSAWLADPAGESQWWREAEKRYQSLSPHPERFDEMRLAQRDCYAVEPNVSVRRLATIKRPTLVVDAGKDEHIPSEQFAILADAIPKSERIYFPEMTHDIQPYFAQIAKATLEFTRKHDSSAA